MTWTHLIVAFLAGYGLMTLLLWFFSSLAAASGRPRTASALVLAGADADRIEGFLRLLHLWQNGGNLVEILVRAGDEATRAIVERLSRGLPGLILLPPGAALEEAVGLCQGESVWLIDLAKVDRRSHVLIAPPWTIFAQPRDCGRTKRNGGRPMEPSVPAG